MPENRFIDAYWLETGGEFGPYGRPASSESEADTSGAIRQAFEGGEIAWCPAQRAVVGVARLREVAVFEWRILDTFNYDYFRYDVLHDGAGAGHTNLTVENPTRGRVWLRLQGYGRYEFRVKGCDAPTVFSGERSRQGYTAFVGVTVGVTPGTPPAGMPTVTGLIAQRWHLFGGWDGPLGKPVAAEETGGGNYHIQRFERGVIARYPDYGPEMAILAYQRGPTIVVHWGLIHDANPNPAGIDTSLFEALNLTAGDTTPEHKQSALYPDFLWFDWCHDAASSNHLRFWPRRDGQYMLRVTDGEGRQFGVQLGFQPVPPTDFLPALDGSPAAAFASHADRALALARHYAHRNPLECFRQPDGEDITMMLIANLHAAAAESAFLANPGDLPPRLLVGVALRDIPVGEVGTDRDYDMTLKGVMTVLHRYPSFFTDEQRDWIVRDLVPADLRGRHDPEIERIYVLGIPGPETENHILMIESTRYLVNQYLYERTGDTAYDNLANGMFDWLLARLQTFACHDFLEFNSRPYQRLSTHALLNLYEFASDHTMTVGAQIVLDYLAVKFAVSSNRKRQIGPFRRRRELTNLSDLFSKNGHPHTGFWQMYAGPSGPDGEPHPGFPYEVAIEGLIVGTSTYRPPPAAYVLAMTEYAPTQHRFFHGQRAAAPHGVPPDPGVETYYKSPSFLLCAGGMFLNSGNLYDDEVMIATGTNACAVAQSTVLVPTRAYVSFAELIRFDPWPGDAKAVNTAVEQNFACGPNLRIPGRPDTEHGWIFIDHSDLGYYVAAYRTVDPLAPLTPPPVLERPTPASFGFIYVLELVTPGRQPGQVPAPSMSFMDFQRSTQERNSLPDPLDFYGSYEFRAPDGPIFSFRFDPTAGKYQRLVHRSDDPGEMFTSLPLVTGPYLSSDDHTGVLTIRHPGCDHDLILDFHNPVHAVRRGSPAGQSWYDSVTIAFYLRARRQHDLRRFNLSLLGTRATLDAFRQAKAEVPDLSDSELDRAAEQWHAAAQAAHPQDVPAQLDAAGNAWLLYQYLAQADASEARRAELANRIENLTGYLAFGSPTSVDVTAAFTLVRRLLEELAGDHRLDIAQSRAREAMRHHETSFVAGCPNPAAEQAQQRNAATEALHIVEPIVTALPNPSLDQASLLRLAEVLTGLLGTLTFGSTDSQPSDRAAELLRKVYANLPNEDHRLDIAESWSRLAMRHHETSFVAGCPNPAAEQAQQRNAATEALHIVEPIVTALPDPSLDQASLLRLAEVLTGLLGTLTFGSTDSQPSDRAAELLRKVYANLPNEDHRLDIAESWSRLAMRHHETSFVAGCPNPAAEQAQQRNAATEALHIVEPIVTALPDPSLSVSDLQRMADILKWVVGLVAYGAPDTTASEHAAELLDAVTAALAASDSTVAEGEPKPGQVG